MEPKINKLSFLKKLKLELGISIYQIIARSLTKIKKKKSSIHLNQH